MALHRKAAPEISPDEFRLIGQLREQLMQIIPNGIPTDLDTNLNLVRWIRGYQKNIEKILQVVFVNF